MKKFINFFKAQLFVAVVLFGVGVSHAQPVVRVPATCNVVVAGTGVGAVTGFGGQVGNGGVVTMPDPFDFTTSSGDFNYIPNSTTLLSWILWGDISVQTVNVPPAAGIYSSGATTPLNIESYNRRLRAAEGPTALLPTSNTKWGRSKGRVRVNYSATPCNNFIEFEIFKTYDLTAPSVVPPIIGPNCLLPNTTYTYSVDQIASDNADDAIGFDKYYWSGTPTGAFNIYNSADNSSITFTTGATVSAFTLKCCYGRANTWDGDAAGAHTTCVGKNVGAQPTNPTFTSSLPSASTSCLNTGVTSFPVVLTTIPGYSYSLTAPGTAWNITQNSAGNWTISVGLDNNPGTLLLTVTNGSCTPVTFSYTINRNFIAPSASISGPTCLLAGSTTNAFNIQTNAVLNPTTWILPSGWSITPFSANGTNSALSITVPSTGTGSTPGTYTVSAKSNSCAGTISLTVYVRPAAPVFASSTPSCVPLSSPAITTFAVTPVAGVTYAWTLPPGWTCSAGCTTANPTLIPPTNTSAVGATAMPAETISVVASSAVGCSSPPATFTVNYVRITTNTLQTGAGNCDQYSINTNTAPCVGTITNWTVGGVTAVNSPTVNIFGNTLTLCGSAAPAAGTICANIVINGVTYNTCSSTIATGTHGLRHTNPKITLGGIIISPNPNDGNFSIRVDGFKESASAIITDFRGNEICKYTLSVGENKVQNDRLVKGTYFVVLSVDGEQETRQIIVK